MDQLAAYESDSDTEQACNPENVIESAVSKLTQKSGCGDKLSSSLENSLLTDSSGTNFFGFIEDRTCATQSIDKEDSNENMCSRTVRVDGLSVEVPDSDFWKPVSEVELSYDSLHNKNSEPQKRKFQNQTESWDPVDKNLPSDCAVVKKRYQQYGENMQKYHEYQSHQNVIESGRICDHITDSKETYGVQTDVKVKLYTVHPKISPHLNNVRDSRCTSKVSHRWAGHGAVINRIAWCSTQSFSHLIVSASMDSTLRVWNAWGQKQACVQTLMTHRKAVRDVQWSEDGRRVLSCSYDGTAAITDVQTGQCQVTLEHGSYVSSGRFHPVTPHIITTGTTDCIHVWDIRRPEVPVRILTHKEQLGQIQDLMFTQGGQELFSCGDVVTRESSDRTIIAWDFRTGVILSNQIFQERYTVTRLCLHPCHQQFLAQTQGGYVALFSTQRPYKMNKNKCFQGHKSAGYNIGLSLSYDGSFVYSGSSDGKLHCYNFNNGKNLVSVDCGDVLLDVAAHPVLPSVVAGATWDGDIVIFQ